MSWRGSGLSMLIRASGLILGAGGSPATVSEEAAGRTVSESSSSIRRRRWAVVVRAPSLPTLAAVRMPCGVAPLRWVARRASPTRTSMTFSVTAHPWTRRRARPRERVTVRATRTLEHRTMRVALVSSGVVPSPDATGTVRRSSTWPPRGLTRRLAWSRCKSAGARRRFCATSARVRWAGARGGTRWSPRARAPASCSPAPLTRTGSPERGARWASGASHAAEA